MSRIHEALLRAEEERAALNGANLVPQASPFAEPVLPSVAEIAGEPMEASLARNTIGLPGEFQKCKWNPDRQKMVFFNPENNPVSIEVFRTLRSKLYSERSRRHLKTVLITSAASGEGKSFVAANLAQAIGHQQSERVLLVDADLRQSTLHNCLGAPNIVGLSEYLMAECDLHAVVQRWEESSFYFVPSGRRTSKPAELLTSARMTQFLYEAEHQFDWIILDSPPTAAVSDGIVLAQHSDGILLVISQGTPVDAAQQLTKELRDKPILGAVLNRAEKLPSQYVYPSGPAKESHR